MFISCILNESNENIDTATFKLKNGSSIPVVIKSIKFFNPNDKISGNGIKLEFICNNTSIGEANISGIDSDMPFLYDFEVKKKYRNNGYGSAILKYCIDKYKVNDLSVSLSNKNAINLYRKFGFKDRFKYKDGSETLLYMQIHKRGYEDKK